ncbi:hypothetical protein J4443_05065 [Candidatus Woesearchaeota archaeon]|nr:hypothetical protein [Candidatus Woesearchaeota archaeon]
MDCDCEQLAEVREKKRRIRDLDEQIRRYGDLLYSMGEEESGLDIEIALIDRMGESSRELKDYSGVFVKACIDGRIYAMFKLKKKN